MTRAAPGTVLAKPSKYRGDYHVRSRRITKAAHASPTTRCWRCGRTLTEARAKWGRHITWHAGHITLNGRELRAEDSHCNIAERNARRRGQPRSRRTTPLRSTTRRTPTRATLNTSRRW